MLPPEPVVGAGDREPSESLIRQLREQVSQLELAVLERQESLETCQERLAIFESAACERLRVIEQGAALLYERDSSIKSLELAIARLRHEFEALASDRTVEREQSERANREALRGMAELALRESALTREIVELRNEGLLHSIIRRIGCLLS